MNLLIPFNKPVRIPKGPAGEKFSFVSYSAEPARSGLFSKGLARS